MSAPEDICRIVADSNGPLEIVGGGSKRAFLDPVAPACSPLDIRGHAGIISYEPKELVLRAKAGTTIADLLDAVHAEGQILAFDPPPFSGQATLGGTVACATSGARRPWYGAVRDFVLGVGLITADGEYLEFGGQVMKNVAGFDVSRLMCGAHGTLGVIADVSLKTLPAPESEITVVLEKGRHEAHELMLDISNRSLPVSGLAWTEGLLSIRWSGAAPAVDAARASFGGDESRDDLWRELADYSRFDAAPEVWRVSVAPASTLLIDEASVIEWGGALRWVTDPETDVRDHLGGSGHATLVRGPAGIPRGHPLGTAVAGIHQRIKATFDPDNRFNPGRLPN